MLDPSEIDALFRYRESDRVERKASFKNKREEIRQAICAFANDLPDHRRPGVVFVGQNDDGSCAGLAITDEMEREAGGFRADGQILPFPSLTVSRRRIDGCEVLAIVVPPHERPPVRVDGRTWIRIGPRRGLATVEEERRLAEKQQWRNVPFDMRPVREAGLDALDLVRFEREYVFAATSPEIRGQNERTTSEKLRALRLLTPKGEPTSAAILLIGADPQQFFPGAYIQFLRIDGPNLTDPIRDKKEIFGTLPDQILRADELIQLNIATSVSIGATRRVERADYPRDAIVQVLRNALLHRNYEGSNTPVRFTWYSDRIEILSPGGLFGEVTPETIWRNVTSYRNPAIAEGLKSLGLVERFGFGLARAQQTLADNGNPPLRGVFDPNYVLFVIEARQ
ncbi:MAG: ATP-binding protein [Roseiarcus sp.]